MFVSSCQVNVQDHSFPGPYASQDIRICDEWISNDVDQIHSRIARPLHCLELGVVGYKPGPGSELRKMLAWFARPSDTCKCETRAETINDWGVEGCRTNLDTNIEWLFEEAQLRGLPHGKFTRTIAKSLVLTAIRWFERKFPDSAPEPNEDEQEE